MSDDPIEAPPVPPDNIELTTGLKAPLPRRPAVEQDRLLLQELTAAGRTGQPMRIDRRRRRRPRDLAASRSLRTFRRALELADEEMSKRL